MPARFELFGLRPWDLAVRDESMSNILIGTCDYPHDRARYLEEFMTVEHHIGGLHPPGDKMLKAWAAETPEGFRHIWVASKDFIDEPKRGSDKVGQALGHFVDSQQNRSLWGEVKARAAMLDAKIILLDTPAAFTPSPANKDRLRHFASEWSKLPEGVELAWFAAGFWEREECAELCEELGIIYAVDPLVDPSEPLPDHAKIYFRLLGAHGLRDHYSDDALEMLIEICEEFEEATVIFKTAKPIKDALRLKALLDV